MPQVRIRIQDEAENALSQVLATRQPIVVHGCLMSTCPGRSACNSIKGKLNRRSKLEKFEPTPLRALALAKKMFCQLIA